MKAHAPYGTPGAVAGPQDQRLVRPREAYARCAISESTARRLIAAGRYPRPITLSLDRHGRALRIAFLDEEISAWISARVRADREGPDARGR